MNRVAVQPSVTPNRLDLNLKIILVLLFGLLTINPVRAEKMVTEVIPLGFHTLAEIIPVIRPLVPRPGSVTGMQNQLVIRTSPANLREVKEILAKLDYPPRRLMISVKRDRRENLRNYGTEVTGSVSSGDVTLSTGKPSRNRRGLNISGTTDGNHRANMRVYSNRHRSDEVGVQRIQTLEGREAFISVGQAVPFAQRNLIVSGAGATVHDTISYKDVTTGFYVIPRLNGDRVTLDIHPRSARLSRRGGGVIDVEDARTVVSGYLGKWMTIGGATGSATGSGRGTVYSTHRSGDSDLVILLKVEELQ